jgi:transcriptional regulator with GAF, ATPase, and Fis domain
MGASHGSSKSTETEIIGSSPEISDAVARAGRVARYACPVIVSGETGTGKELFARLIHEASPRADKPFVAINCATIQRELAESELFGHVKGAFTGAVAPREGAFQQADGGTLFLDEIGELPLELQPKLLRVLQQGEVRPVGGSFARRVDVRVVAATHRDLLAMAADGRFREDLYYRLAKYTVRLPALRERGHDVVLIARDFLRRSEWADKALSTEAEDLLARCAWPGNVRQLENVLTAAAIDTEGSQIGAREISAHLPSAARREPPDGDTLASPPPQRARGVTSRPRRDGDQSERVARRLLRTCSRLSPTAFAQAIGLGRRQTHRVLRELEARGIIRRQGRGRGSHFVAGPR